MSVPPPPPELRDPPDLELAEEKLRDLADQLEETHYSDLITAREIHVDRAAGDDANRGRPNDPLKTLDAAVALGLNYLRTRIILAPSQVYPFNQRHAADFKFIEIVSEAAAPGDYPIIQVASQPGDDCAGFDCRASFFNLEKLIVNPPVPESGAVSGNGPATAMFHAEQLGHAWVSAENCIFNLRETALLRAGEGGFVSFAGQTVTFNNSSTIGQATLLIIEGGLAALTVQAASGNPNILALRVRGKIAAADGEYTNLITNLNA